MDTSNINEVLDYIILNQSDNIDDMKLADVCRWVSLEAEDKDSPLYGLDSLDINGELITLILDEIKVIPELENYKYKSASGWMTSIFTYATINTNISINSRDMLQMLFQKTTFTGGIVIDSKIIYDKVFNGSRINCSVYINDGCTDLGESCLGAIWGANSSLSLPESLEFIDPYALFNLHGRYLPLKIEFRGTIDKFDELMLVTEEDLTKRDKLRSNWPEKIEILRSIWPKKIECVDGTWDLEEYFKRRTIE